MADDQHVVLSVPLSGTWIDIRFTLTEAIRSGGAPVVEVSDAATAMRSVLAIAAGVDGSRRVAACGGWDRQGHRHLEPRAGRRSHRRHRHLRRTAGADAHRRAGCPGRPLLARGVRRDRQSAVTDSGFPVVEGLLSLVHLDHAAHLLAALPTEPAELTVTATASAAHDTEVGRVVPV